MITPDADPMDATPGLLLIHVPPVAVSDKVTVWPGHALSIPDITEASGDATTFTVVVTVEIPQPVGTE